jgi:hypothetical protein
LYQETSQSTATVDNYGNSICENKVTVTALNAAPVNALPPLFLLNKEALEM